MKRIIYVLLALCLLAISAPAWAEAAEGAPLTLAEGELLIADLDGDGTDEALSCAMAPDQYDDFLTLTVTGADGASHAYASKLIWSEAVYVVDLDGDGAQEILLTGDVMSDDYYTWCLRWDGAALYEVLFPDASRGGNTDSYFKWGYGQITSIADGRVTLSGTQDALGTWFAARTVALSPYDRFEFDDDGLWVREPIDADDPDLWEYRALTVTRPLNYTDEAGNPAGTLQAGDKLLVCATDKASFVRFLLPDGTVGRLEVAHDYSRGWGFLVDGMPEDDCFESIPYAD